MTITLNIFNNVISKVNILLLSVIVLLIPIHHKYLSPFIGLWVITSIVLIISTKQKLTKNKSQLALIGFYMLLAIGLLWTDNQKAGGFDLEVKMSLIIFPLLFLFLRYTKAYIKFVMYSFLLGILIGASYLLYQSYLFYQINHAIDSFFYINLSTIIHPSYLSFYVVTAILVLLIDLRYRVLGLFKYDALTVSFLAFLFVLNMLLLSKIGIVVGLFVILFFTIQWIVTKKKYVLGLGILLMLVFSFYISYQKSIYVKQRVNELVVGLTATEGDESNSSTGIRLKIWKEGLLLIKEQPFLGHGTGDVKDVLMKKYQQNGIDDAYTKKLNAHNQFIQVGIGLGMLGLCVFLSVFYFGLVNGLKQHNYFIFGFLWISIIFMLPESILENQAGTIFFGLFFSLFNQKSVVNNKT